jgi:hypothetical protein
VKVSKIPESPTGRVKQAQGSYKKSAAYANIPDVRDGLTQKERVILYCLDQLQKELGGRNSPTIMLYGRVLEHVDISEYEFQSILAKFAGLSKLSS